MTGDIALGAPVQLTVDKGRKTEYGAGMSVAKGAECFVVVPKHVIEGSRKITVTDQERRSAEAVRFADASDGSDAALIKLQPGSNVSCAEDWDDGSRGQAMLQDAGFLVARKVKDGSVQQRRLFLNGTTSTTMTLTPYDATKLNALVEGDSGSSVYAGNALVGMILNVDTATGAATALNQSQLHGLFGSMVLDSGQKSVYLHPVIYRNAENRYATVALQGFVSERTTLQVVDLPSNVKAANLRALRYGKPVENPPNVDYVISTQIIDFRARNEANPNYDRKAADESNFGKQLLNSMSNKSVRYINVSNVDVEVTIEMPESQQQMRNIIRREYKVPLSDKIDQRKLPSDLQTRAAVESVSAMMLSAGMPVIQGEEPEPKKKTLLDLFR
jgi:hypothetical protein